jgi:TolA-binding protein
MKRQFGLSVVMMVALVAPTLAACPPMQAGSTPEEIKANELRILCLQRELNEATTLRNQQMQLDAINRRLRELQTQIKSDAFTATVPVYRPEF